MPWCTASYTSNSYNHKELMQNVTHVQQLANLLLVQLLVDTAHS